MSNSVSHAALPYPIKNARFTIAVPYLDADGDPTDPTTPDTEVSQDGGAFADAAEEVTTISGSNGLGYITLTGAETNNSIVGVCAKVTSGPKATIATLYPRVLASVGTGTLSAGSAGGGTLGTLLAYDVTGCFIMTTGGTGGGGTGGANNQARRIVTYNTSTGAFTVAPNWETAPSTDTTYSVLLPEGVTLGMLKTLNPATAGRTLVVDSAGLADANVVKIGPTGSGTAQTARDIGASVLISSGTGTGQLSVSSGVIAANVTQIKGTTSVGTAGYVGIDWAAVLNQDSIVSLSATTVATVTTASNMITQANVRTAVGLASANLDTQLAVIAGYIDTEVAAIVTAVNALPSASTIATAVWSKDLSAPAVAGTAADYLKDAAAMTDQFFTMTELDGGVYRFTTNSLEQSPSGASAEDIADAVIAAGSSIAYVGPVATGGDIEIIRGDDYSLAWTVTGWPTFVGATAVTLSLTLGGVTTEFTGSATSATGLLVELTPTQSASLAVGTHKGQVHVTLAGGDKITPLVISARVIQRVGT